jgi:hypothetical protein
VHAQQLEPTFERVACKTFYAGTHRSSRYHRADALHGVAPHSRILVLEAPEQRRGFECAIILNLNKWVILVDSSPEMNFALPVRELETLALQYALHASI